MTKHKMTLFQVAIVLGALLLSLPLIHARTTISFWHGYSELETVVLEGELIPRFEQAHPDIQVEAVRMGYDDLRDKIVTTAASGTGPDVVRIDIIWNPSLSEAGLLEPLDSYDGFADTVAQVYPGPLSTSFLADAYYGLPLSTNTQVLIYDKAAFAQAGLTVPGTFKEFEDTARRLTRRQDDMVTSYGYDMAGPWAWNLLPWIWSNGGNVTDSQISTAAGYLDGDGTVAALDTISRWAMEGLLAPNIFGDDFDQWGSFVRGITSLRQDGPWFARWLEDENPDFTAGFALMPKGDGGESISVVGGENIAMARGSKQKEEAWLFMRFLLSEEAQGVLAASGQIPIVLSALSFPEFRASDYYPVYLEQLLTAKARTPHPRYNDMENVMQDAFRKAITGETSARIALTEAARLVDGMLQ